MFTQSNRSLTLLALGAGLLGLGACTDEDSGAADAGPLAGQSAQAGDSAPEVGGGPSGSAEAGASANAGTMAETAGMGGQAGSANAGSGGSPAVDAGTAPTTDAGAASTELSAAESDSLLFTREEEKLARDVYTKLQGKDPVFENIAASEQTHMDAVATLLDRYGLSDPAKGKAAGEFTNTSLQALYDRLNQEGSASTIAALQVGLEIEELDLRDIEQASAAVTHPDILRVYEQLTRGSRNHLRAFYARLTALDATYTPKYLDAATFDQIATSSRETGP